MPDFLLDNNENPDLNQYWYSAHTIQIIVEEITELNGKVAFLSTPSLYFSCPPSIREKSYVFDYDTQWNNDRGYIFFDFNQDTIQDQFKGYFDVVVIDPPFITEEVWRKYHHIATQLIKPNDGKYILTTIQENAGLLHQLFSVQPNVFQPSIPHLVYQYELYTNYPSQRFQQKNKEIPE